MQRTGTTPTPQHATNTPLFSAAAASSSSSSSTSFFGGINRTRTNTAEQDHRPRSRPGTSSGERPDTQSNNSNSNSPAPPPTVSVFEQDKEKPRLLTKERKASFSRKPSFGSPSKSKRRANSSSSSTVGVTNGPNGSVITDSAAPPALPDFALSAAAKLTSRDSEVIVSPPSSTDDFSKMLSRTAPTPVNGYTAVQPPAISTSSSAQATENVVVYGHIQEMANKRISTLDYLRKAHEGRVYWFNTLLFTQADLSRLPSFASARIARRATNYLLLGLSLPTVIDFNSNTPIEFLRSLNMLLTEFDAFQSLHSDGSSSGSLTRNRIPQMFRRVPGGKTRRTSGQASDIGLPMGASQVSLISNNTDTYTGSLSGGPGGEGVMQFGAAESESLPGEDYTYLLTPNLPFEPDFFETFATLCDVLIDAYTKLMSLLPSPKDCNQQVAELFAKADGKVRKIIVEGCVKEFQDCSRNGIRSEMASVGKVVLGGLV